MSIRISVQELQDILAKTQTRIKKLEAQTREFLIYHECDPHGELENMWAELEFLQAKEDAILTQISMQSANPKDLDSLFQRIQKEIKTDS